MRISGSPLAFSIVIITSPLCSKYNPWGLIALMKQGQIFAAIKLDSSFGECFDQLRIGDKRRGFKLHGKHYGDASIREEAIQITCAPVCVISGSALCERHHLWKTDIVPCLCLRGQTTWKTRSLSPDC